MRYRPAPAAPADIEIASLLAAVRRSGLRLIAVSAVVGVATYGTLSMFASRYTSEAQLAVVAKSTNPLPDHGDRSGDASLSPRLDKEAINTHVRALMAPDLLQRVAAQLELRSRPEFNSAQGSIDLPIAMLMKVGIPFTTAGETDDDRVMAVVSRQLEVSAIRDSRFISVRFTSADPAVAAEFANRLAEAYRAELVATPVQETTDVMQAMQPKVTQLEHEVLNAEAEIESYRARTDQFRGGAQSVPINDQRMASLNDELIRAESQRDEAEARWRTSRQMMAAGNGEVVPEVQRSALIQGLVQQRVQVERQLAEAGATLLPAHPRMKQLQADLAGLKAAILVEVQKSVAGLEKDWNTLSIRADTIKAQIEAQKAKVEGGTGNEVQLRSLEAAARAKRAELERLQKQLEDNRSVVNMNKVPIEAQIVSRARPTSAPTYPRKGPYALLASMGSMILGFAAVITRQLVGAVPDQSRNGGSRQPTGPSGHELVARRRAARPSRPLPADDVVMPSLGEAIPHILANRPLRGGRRTLVVASQPDVDTLEEALAIARATARKGETVLVARWDLHELGSLQPLLDTSRPGLNDVLSGDALFDQVIVRFEPRIHMLAPGRSPQDEAVVLDPEALNVTLDVLDEIYDHFIITGERTDIAALFQAIEGRFDIAIEMVENARKDHTQAGELLGFNVQGIEVIRVIGEPDGDWAEPRRPTRNAA